MMMTMSLPPRKSADRIDVSLDYVEGSNRILEKLASGQWDEPFIVVEPGRTITPWGFLRVTDEI